MDFSMPILNGIEATKEIRKFINCNNYLQPIIVGVTGHVQESFKKEGLDAGMDKIYPKPFYLKDLEEVLKQYYFQK